MKPKDIIALVFGSLALIGINVVAFIFDAEWIRDAIIVDVATITAIITYYFKNSKSS